MDIETLLRNTLADQAHHAPRAGEDFLDQAVAARWARRRRTAYACGSVAAVTVLVGAVIATTSVNTAANTATPSPSERATNGPTPTAFIPAPPPAEQQAQLADDLGITDPPPVPINRLVTPGQAQRLWHACITEAGWSDEAVRETTTIDVTTGEVSTRSYAGGYSVPSEQEQAFNLDSYICMASYPIDPGYTEDSRSPYVRSALITAIGPGQALTGYQLTSTATTPATEGTPNGEAPSVSWVNEGEFIAITTWADATCPTVPVSWTTNNGELAIETGQLNPDGLTCGGPRAAHTTIFEIPMGVDTDQNVSVSIDGAATALPAVS